MNRAALLLAGLFFVVAGLAPIAAMAARGTPADLAAELDARTLALLARTVAMGLAAAALAVLLGAPFGFLVARTDLPGAAALRSAGLVPLLIPPVFLAMAATAVFPGLNGTAAVVLVLGVGSFPIVALFTARAFERIDARREEAARLAGGWAAALRMELPLVAPAIACAACLCFVLAVEDFAVADFVASVGVPCSVYADEIFSCWQSVHRPGLAVAAALPLTLVSAAALVPALRLRRRGALATLDGRFVAPGRRPLGRARWPWFALVVALLAVTAAAPIGRFVFDAGGGRAGHPWTAARMGEAFSHAFAVGGGDLARSTLFAALAALLALIPALLLGHAFERSRRARWLDLLVLLPLSVPPILFGIGCIALWNHDATAGFYEGEGLAVLLLTGRFAAFPLLAVTGAVAALDVEAEEAGRMAGAAPLRRLVSIVAPAVKNALFGGAGLVFVFALREVDAIVLVPAASRTAMFRIYNALHYSRSEVVAALVLIVIALILVPGMLWSLFLRARAERVS